MIAELWRKREKEKRERKSAFNRLKKERMKERVGKKPVPTSAMEETNTFSEETHSHPVDYLISCLFQCKSLHVAASSASLYRNKVSYTLRPPLFSVSPLARPEINKFVRQILILNQKILILFPMSSRVASLVSKWREDAQQITGKER